MFGYNGCHFSYTFLILIVAVTAKPPPIPSPWATYSAAKSVYPKSLGPPSGLDTITVPYGPKMSPFFPKFVDPKAMITSKTDFLNNLFGGVGPVNYPSTAPVLYSINTANDPPNDISDLENIISTDNSDDKVIKRSMFGPMSGKFNPSITPFGGAASPKFTPELNFPFANAASQFGVQSRRKRSVIMSKPAAPINFGPPPPYPGLSPITEESDSDTSTSATVADIPKQYLPGIFGPFGPFGVVPSSSMIDPSFFATKKTTFLNTLFSNLATSTPATAMNLPTPKSTIVPPNFWSPIETSTAIPIPKSTIVPPDFWAPSSIIPTPGEYTDKVTTFLDKLVESIKLNKIKTAANTTAIGDIPSESKSYFARSLISDPINKTKITNSIDDLATITAAKDAIVDSIIAELSSLKADMINNLDQLILAEQLQAAKISSSSSSSPVGKKPVKPFKAAFAGLWGPPPPTDPALPYKQKMTALSEVFDMLTELQKNITTAVADAIQSHSSLNEATPLPIADPSSETYNGFLPINSNSVSPSSGKYPTTFPKGPAPFWSFYSQSDTVKRHIDNDDYDLYDDNQHDSDDRNNYKRAVKMSMHQGYQSMPPGTVESVQAGGGSVPGHQGGGIKLLSADDDDNDESWKQWAKWGDYIKNQYKDERHHHNHH